MAGTASRQLALFADRASPPDRDVAAPARPALGAVLGFAQFVRLLSLDPGRNRYRFYALTWQPCLWGGGALIRSWGRLGTPERTLTAFYPDRPSAEAAIRRLLRRRLRHGYRVVAWQ